MSDFLRAENGVVHTIGTIQSVGYVLVVEYLADADIRVQAVSENLFSQEIKWFPNEIKDVLGQRLNSIFIQSIVETITRMVLRYRESVGSSERINTMRNSSLLSLDDNSTAMFCSLVGCRYNNMYILEMEEASVPALSTTPIDHLLRTGEIIGRMKAKISPEEVTAAFCDEVMSMFLEYDRGMVYQFGYDGSGTVLYERVREGRDLGSSYLGLRFPAEDIPPIARELYIKNCIRFLYDINGVDSKLLSYSEDRADVSLTYLRANSPCHAQYLRNMGVVATMTIAIVVNGHLWGLIPMHSYSKLVKPSHEQRIGLDMMASICSMSIDAYEKEQAVARKLAFSQVIFKSIGFNHIQNFLHDYHQTILHCLQANAIILRTEDVGDFRVFGDATVIPTSEGYQILFTSTKFGEIFVSNTFRAYLSGNGAGIAFYRESGVEVGIIRNCVSADVRWAGNPSSASEVSDHNLLHPRASFALFIEKAHMESKPFDVVERELIKVLFERLVQCALADSLANVRLSLKQSNAECVDAIKSQEEHYEFFAHMSHELRTPFHGVISSMQILKSGNDKLSTEERDEIVSSALESGRMMLSTLNDILDVAKNRNCVEAMTENIVVRRMFAITQSVLGPMAEERQINFLMTYGLNESGSDWAETAITSDETRILQTVNNFVNNAIKFTPPHGAVNVRVNLIRRETLLELRARSLANYQSHHVVVDLPNYEKEGTIFLSVDVIDSGCGIRPDSLPDVFGAYKQIASGTQKTYQGTGLGLHICHLHMQLMGGSILVASTEGKGTLFHCVFPTTTFQFKSISAEMGDKTATTADSLLDLKTIQDIAERKKIVGLFLIVDDSQVNQRLASRKISMALGTGVTFLFANDGLEAVEAVSKLLSDHKYSKLSGILMDYRMPRCDGVEAIHRIRLLEAEFSAPPVYTIGFTADVTDTSTSNLLGAGSNEVLSKPTPTGVLENLALNLILKQKL